MGVMYSRYLFLSPQPCYLRIGPLAAHIGLYYMKKNKPEGSLKSIIFLGSMGIYRLILRLCQFELLVNLLYSIMASHPERTVVQRLQACRSRLHAFDPPAVSGIRHQSWCCASLLRRSVRRLTGIQSRFLNAI
jgi:hypothetical protein